jgi:imidazole glycerol phosphate synthase, glutamine amidotransferase subunit
MRGVLCPPRSIWGPDLASDIAVIDYGSGNLKSVANAVARVTDRKVHVSSDPTTLAMAGHVILPGVGAFGDCMAGLQAVSGLKETLCDLVLEQRRPFLGICVGMQLMVDEGHEHGNHQGLGWVHGHTSLLAPEDQRLRVPHMGWNRLSLQKDHPVLADLDGEDVYFVHSYAVQCDDADHLIATTEHGGPVTAIIGRDNMLGVQFHPEKSQAAGLSFLSQFLRWQP